MPAVAAEGGHLGTLMLGVYECEKPGSPGSAHRRPEPAASFTITSSSRYIAADGSVGTYLRIGKMVQMTSGFLSGTRFAIIRPTFLRRIESGGEPGPLRCVLSRATDGS